MKKLSLYIFLVLMFCNNVNADLNSKDKFIFLCYPGNDQSTLSGGGWEINLIKMTATTIYITTSGEITSFEEYTKPANGVNVHLSSLISSSIPATHLLKPVILDTGLE